jgi:hypothetical protein
MQAGSDIAADVGTAQFGLASRQQEITLFV